MALTPAQFAERWRNSSLTERSAAQSHFIDLCEMLGESHPAASDSVGERFTFEKPVRRTYGGKGFADVWRRDHFGWEYKGKHKNLDAAYRQLNDYREDLDNPPLLVVCDMDLFEVHTNFTATTKRIYSFSLDDLEYSRVTPTCPLPPLEVLRALFGDYSVLRPDRTDARVTQDVAKIFCRLAERLELEKGSYTETPVNTKEEIAHFLMRILFCLFADSIGLLPKKVFRSLLQGEDRFSPKKFLRKLKALFVAMSAPDGIFGEHSIKYFNGGLFDSDSVIELDKTDLTILYEVSKNYDWAHIAPEIFGTLFERSLNRERRSLVGAHYTSAEDILLLIEPVMMQPLQRRWADFRTRILIELEAEGPGRVQARKLQAKARRSHELLAEWLDELTQVRVLDPACGSGNFLYLALRRMLDLWLETHRFAVENKISLVLPEMVSPRQLYGIEIELLAHELASIVVWIGYLQWKHEHGILDDREPILQKLENIQHADAIIQYSEDGAPFEPKWPKADFIVGNPPFLGDKKMRRELDIRTHASYTTDLRMLYKNRVPGGADLVTFWFEKARSHIDSMQAKRAGLLATNSIRMVGNRPVLESIKRSGAIFMAWSDRPWLLDGAAVRVSMIGFDDGSEPTRFLDGEEVDQIHSDLTANSNVAGALPLSENEGLCFLGVMKGGPFDISSEDARRMLHCPINPNGRPNSDVVKRRLGGQDITKRDKGGWIIDFGINMPVAEAALYEGPFEYVKKHVKPLRNKNNRKRTKERWWIHGEARPGLRKAISRLSRCIVTPEVAKHRVFVWMDTSTVPDHTCHVIASDNDYMFGVLSSNFHEIWSLSQGARMGAGNDPRYSSARTFDTFPFPWPPGKEPSSDSCIKGIAEAARSLVVLREKWLNPVGAIESEIRSRTLTKLYNKKPAWLENAHQTLDRAVFAAYGWAYPLSREEILHRLLELNRLRAASQTDSSMTVLPPKKAAGSERSRRTAAAKVG